MKIAPIYFEMKKQPLAFEPVIVHTGQHYDENMSRVFFDDLELPRPDIYLDVGSGSHAEQTAEIIRRFEPQLNKHRPDLVIVVGDVNSTIACALTAIKIRFPSDRLTELWTRYDAYLNTHETARSDTATQMKQIRAHEAPIIAHVEAGERSFDFSMPEEINRVTTDVLSDILFTTCSDADKHLIEEGADSRKIYCVGNIMIDSLQKNLEKASNSNILNELNSNHLPEHFQPIKAGDFALATLHRAGNVDDPAKLTMILAALLRVSAILPVLFPMHPRTRKLLENHEGELLKQILESQILIAEPLGYLDFLHLQTKACFVLTDSGGVQVETSYLGIPCLTLRPNTEWQITIREGTNELVPMNEEAIVHAAKRAFRREDRQPAKIKNWDGGTADRIVNILRKFFQMI